MCNQAKETGEAKINNDKKIMMEASLQITKSLGARCGGLCNSDMRVDKRIRMKCFLSEQI